MKFYQKNWFIWLCLIVFAPLGIILLWTQKKYKPFTRVILSVVFLIFFIIILPTGESNEPASNNIANNTLSTLSASESPVTQEEDPEEEPEEKPEEQKPEYEIEVTAKDLAKAFDENEIRANQNYKGKIAKITGKISDIGEAFGQTYIVLSNEDDTFSNFVEVQCFFKDKDEINKIAEKNKGDKTVIIGEIDGKSLNVTVSNCKFFE